ISRTFIPSRVGQNRFLASTGYAKMLGMLPEPLRSQMLLGDFTAGREDAAMQVIPSEWVKSAQERWKARPRPSSPMSAMGVDVARGGGDSTVLTPRYGDWIDKQVSASGKATPDGSTAAALVLQHRRDDAVVLVDVIGWGASAFDVLRERLGSKAVALNGANGSDRRDKTGRLRFVNKPAQRSWA